VADDPPGDNGKRYAVTVDQSAPATSHRRELRNQMHTADALL